MRIIRNVGQFPILDIEKDQKEKGLFRGMIVENRVGKECMGIIVRLAGAVIANGEGAQVAGTHGIDQAPGFYEPEEAPDLVGCTGLEGVKHCLDAAVTDH